MGVRGQHHVPAYLPPGKTWYLMHRRLSDPQSRSGWVWNISPPPGFDPRTVRPVASRTWKVTDLYIHIYLLFLHITNNEELSDLYSTNLFRGNWIAKNGMGGACSTRGWEKFWWGNLREREHWEDPGVDGRAIWRQIFRKWERGAWTGLSWLRIGTRGGHLWMR